ncbi:MAG: hypothetical protein ACYTAN_11980 [Planctomycetota bacterium]
MGRKALLRDNEKRVFPGPRRNVPCGICEPETAVLGRGRLAEKVIGEDLFLERLLEKPH